jgi:Protein of unknown function (DUF4245)
MSAIPKAVAGLALVAVTVVGCGDEDGNSPAASDPSASDSTSSSPTAGDSPSATESTPEPTPTNGDPVPSPIINKAVKAAIKADFPALVPAGVPAGWTVAYAKYSPKRTQWIIAMTDPANRTITLTQGTADADGVAAHLLPDGKSDGTVKISGTGSWTSYTGSTGAALAKNLSGTGAVVFGADAGTVRVLAEQLLTAEDSGDSDGG